MKLAALLFLTAIVAFALAIVAMGMEKDIVAWPLFFLAFAFLLATSFLRQRS